MGFSATEWLADPDRWVEPFGVRKLLLAPLVARDRVIGLIALDHTDARNDRHGHLAGDDLLQDLAGLIHRLVRQVDTATRYGGEEFAVILSETDSAQALAVAERLRETVRSHAFVARGTQQTGRVTVSIGVAIYPRDAKDAEELVNAADMALLCAKVEKDRVCVARSGTE